MQKRARHSLFGTLLWAIAACFVTPASAQDISEAQVKAAFVYNFLKFAELSHLNSPEVQLCVAVSDEDRSAFLALDKKPLEEKMVQVQLLRSKIIPRTCNVLYLDKSSDISASIALKPLTEMGMFTIGDADDFIIRGGMIRLFSEDSRIRFEISLSTTKAGGIKLSSKLLAIARVAE